MLERKLTGYLLSTSHPTGRHKASWLLDHGFTRAKWKALAEALRVHAVTHEVAAVEVSPFGARYVVEGQLVTPHSRNPLARSVWFVEAGDDVPQFVTIYPLRGGAR